jgi:endoglucanase
MVHPDIKCPILACCAPVIAALVVGACVYVGRCDAQETSFAAFHHGIGVAHVLAWAPVEPGNSHTFSFPPFRDSGKFDSELKVIRQTGFDFIRLAVDPGPFLQFQGARRDQMDRMLLDRVKRTLSSGLAVIVDFHPSDLNEDYTPLALTRGIDTPVFQDYLRLLARTATLLDQLQSRKVALEIMNEPPATSARWEPMLEIAHRVIRDRAPHLLLVLDGADEGSADGISALEKFGSDHECMISFHYYDPYQFTHQGAPWMAARYLADIPYPALARALQGSLDATTSLIAASNLTSAQKEFSLRDATRRLQNYRKSAFDRAAIAKTFDRVAQWARNYQVPASRILLGEFGARKQDGQRGTMRAAERNAWIGDVGAEAEAHGFSWAAWVYRGAGGFALTREEQRIDFDPLVIAALGLKGR